MVSKKKEKNPINFFSFFFFLRTWTLLYFIWCWSLNGWLDASQTLSWPIDYERAIVSKPYFSSYHKCETLCFSMVACCYHVVVVVIVVDIKFQVFHFSLCYCCCCCAYSTLGPVLLAWRPDEKMLFFFMSALMQWPCHFHFTFIVIYKFATYLM